MPSPLAPLAVDLLGRDLLAIPDLGPAELEGLLDLAGEVKAGPGDWAGALAGLTVGLIFEKPSTRTRVSLDVAAYQLGGHALPLAAADLQLTRGETVRDTGLVLSRYLDAIAIRTGAHARAAELAAAATVPVVNALTDDHHPCQALADLQTLRERLGPLAGRRLAWIGDAASNVFHSLAAGAAMLGMEVVCACPPGYEPDEALFESAERSALENGGRIVLCRDPRAAVEGAHVVYTDVWVSMGDEAEQERRLEALARYQVTPTLMSLAAPDAVFLHCLPAHRGLEVAAEVIDGPQSLVFVQAANRLPTEQAVLYALTTGEWE